MTPGQRESLPGPGERPSLLADFPVGQPLPWKAVHQGTEYPGEIIVTGSWAEWDGQLKKDVHFRIVVLTQYQEVSPESIAERRIALCIPAKPSYGAERVAGEYRAIKEKRQAYAVTGSQAEREALESRARQLTAELLKEETALYCAGYIQTRGPVAISAQDVFSLPDNGERFNAIASKLLAATPSWNTVLAYARLLREDLKPATDPDEVAAQESLLMATLKELEATIAGLQSSLAELSSGLGKPLEEEVVGSLERLSRIAKKGSYLDLYSALEHRLPQALSQDISLCQRLEELRPIIPEILAVKAYLEGAEVDEGDAELAMDRISILEQMDIHSLLTNPHLWSSLKTIFDWFKSRYRSLYLSHHQAYHRELSSLRHLLARAGPEVDALKRLNSIPELGEPQGRELEGEYQRLLEQIKPCPDWEGKISLDLEPICAGCRLALSMSPSTKEVEGFRQKLEQALREQQRRLSSEAIRQILAQSREKRIDRFIKVVQTSDLSPLVNVLDDELVSFLRQLLAEAK